MLIELAILLGGGGVDYYNLANQLIDIRTKLPQVKMERAISQTSRGEVLVLNYLLANGNKAYPKDISKAVCLTTARIAAVLKSLEKRSLITRSQDPFDNRQIIVELTEMGILTVKERREALLQSTAKMLEALGEDDAKAYVRIQEKLINLENIWR